MPSLQKEHLPSLAYLTSHKVCIDDRIGKVNATLSLLFKPEDLLKMTPEEIDNKINEAFHHDDYKWNKTQHIKYKSKGRIMTNMQDMLYKCPRCGHEFEMDAAGKYIRCTNCGNGGCMDDYYDFYPFDDTCKIFDTPTDWVDWERVQVIHEIRDNKDFYLEEEVDIGELPKYKPVKDNKKTSIPCGHGKIRFDHDGIHFDGVKNGEPWHFDLSYSVIYSPIIENDLTQFALAVNEQIYDFGTYWKSPLHIIIFSLFVGSIALAGLFIFIACIGLFVNGVPAEGESEPVSDFCFNGCLVSLIVWIFTIPVFVADLVIYLVNKKRFNKKVPSNVEVSLNTESVVQAVEKTKIMTEGGMIADIKKEGEEMHRLHFNTWKNFPWNDYMYEGTELEKK